MTSRSSVWAAIIIAVILFVLGLTIYQKVT